MCSATHLSVPGGAFPSSSLRWRGGVGSSEWPKVPKIDHTSPIGINLGNIFGPFLYQALPLYIFSYSSQPSSSSPSQLKSNPIHPLSSAPNLLSWGLNVCM